MQTVQYIWILRALHYVWHADDKRLGLQRYMNILIFNMPLFDVIYTLSHGSSIVLDPTYVFPDPSADPQGFEPRGRKVVRAPQDRYGHAAVVNTPEKERQRKKRFSAQPQSRNKRVRQ